ncbi:uncharacterized protein LOC120842904, partial [Ixodes scapularis]|uniref:uncharacterized protein LOC120842904 n=1 Tax=Ixodes scapularis TaxID=6945 RepID=UPI001A9E39D1
RHYKQLLSLVMNSEVVQAYFDCVAGLNWTCQDIAGLLFTLADIQKPSSTDVECHWVALAKAKKEAVSALKDITFRKHVLNKPTPKQPWHRAPPAPTSGI